MFRYKIIVLMAVFTLGLVLVADVLAGEKVKFRDANYRIKIEPVAVGDEEGHVVVLWESRGICTNLEGKKFLDGWLHRQAGLTDANRNAGTWSTQGYSEFIDPDGDKIYAAWEGKKVKQDIPGEGTVRLIKGTGKWQGIQGKGNWISYSPSTDRVFSNVEWDVEWPR